MDIKSVAYDVEMDVKDTNVRIGGISNVVGSLTAKQIEGDRIHGATSEEAATLRPDSQTRHICFRSVVVLLLCSCNACLYISRANMSIAVVWMYDDPSARALILSAFYVGYPMMQIAAGILAGRCGGKVILATAVGLWCDHYLYKLVHA